VGGSWAELSKAPCNSGRRGLGRDLLVWCARFGLAMGESRTATTCAARRRRGVRYPLCIRRDAAGTGRVRKRSTLDLGVRWEFGCGEPNRFLGGAHAGWRPTGSDVQAHLARSSSVPGSFPPSDAGVGGL